GFRVGPKVVNRVRTEPNPEPDTLLLPCTCPHCLRVAPSWSCAVSLSCILVPSCTLALTCTLVPTRTHAPHADHTFALSVGRMAHCLLNSRIVHRLHPRTPQRRGKRPYPCASNPCCQPRFRLASRPPQ